MSGPDRGAPAAAAGDAAEPPVQPAAEAAEASLVPEWLTNLASLSWRLVAITLLVVVAGYLAMSLAVVTAAIAVAVVVSAVLVPATRALRARGRSRTGAAIIVWMAGLVVIGLLAVLLAIALLPELANVAEELKGAAAQLRAELESTPAPVFAADLADSVLGTSLGVITTIVSQVVGTAAAIVTSLVLATFLVFFLLRDGDRAWAWSLQAMPPSKRARLTQAGEDALGRVGGYLVGTTVLSAIVASTDLVFMLVLGVPEAFPLALLVFLAGYIPYFGGIVTTLMLLAVTYGALGTGPTVVLLALITLRNMLMAYTIRPSIYGKRVSLHPALVLIALPAGYEVAGVIGLFAAVPLLAVVLAVASAVVEAVEPDEPPELPQIVPPWLDRIAQWSWRLLAALVLVALAIAVVAAVPVVVVPAVMGVILAATFSPVVRWLEGRGRAPGVSIALALGGSFLLMGALVLLSLGVLVDQGTALAGATSLGARQVDATAGGSAGLLVEAVDQLGGAGLQSLATAASGIAMAGLVTILSLLLGFYFLRDGDRLWAKALQHVEPGRTADVDATGRRAFEVLGGYMYGTAAISFVGAFSQLVIMVVLGIPLALPVFVLSFILCFIPYIGGFISTGAALLVTIAVGTPTDVAVMVVWTLVFNIVTGNIVSPLVYGKTVHLHPAIVLVAIPVGSIVAGILGMLLVVPVLGVIAVSWRTVLRVIATERHEDPAAGPSSQPGDPDTAYGASEGSPATAGAEPAG